MKRIALYIVSYNQEDVIRRTLDSVLMQKEWGLYRVIISDDCSTDDTWNILLEYQKKYPEIVFPYRNEHNLGIYANVERAESLLPESDLYCEIAGDDEFCVGYFESVQKLIEDKGIDTNEAVGIYSDWKTVLPDGREIIHKQDAVLSGHSLWSLKARGIICGRSLMVTKKVRDSYEAILHGCGLNLTESHYDSQPHLNIEYAFYIPQVTSVYYSGIGVSSRLLDTRSDYLTTQSIEKWNYGIKRYVHNKFDLHYAEYELLKAGFYLKPSWRGLFRMWYHYSKGRLRWHNKTLNPQWLGFLNLARYKLLFKK